MRKKMNPWILFLVVLGALIGSYEAENTADDILKDLVSYDHRIPPHGSAGPGSPVVVAVSMYILDINKVDDINQEFTTQMYFRQFWRDPRLRYRDGNTKYKLLHYEDLTTIWRPDLFFVDEIHGKQHIVTAPNTLIRWTSDGDIFLSMKLTLTTRCEMDLRYYPHDEQICTFQIESFSHQANVVKLMWKTNNQSWDAVGLPTSILEKNFLIKDMKYSIDDVALKTGNYTQLFLSINLIRNPGFFTKKLYIPYIILTIVSWMSLWINPKLVLLRLSLLLCVLCIMFLLAFDMSNYVPRVTYTKGIDVWTGFCISFVFALFLEFIFVAQKLAEKEKPDLTQITTEMEPLDKNEKGTKLSPLKAKLFQSNFYTRGKNLYLRSDYISRYVFPVLFGVFNLIYWSVYTS